MQKLYCNLALNAKGFKRLGILERLSKSYLSMPAPLIRYYANLVELPAKTELLLLVGLRQTKSNRPPRLSDVTKRSARATPYARLRYPSSPPSF